MSQALRVLFVEDRVEDAELMVRELKRAGFDLSWHRVDTEPDYAAALTPALDVILCDFNLPRFDALKAIELLKSRGLDIPVIVVSGTIGEETAVQVLRHGAADYLLKDRMARLGQAVQRVVDDRRLQRAKRHAEDALSATEARMRFALEASRVGVWETEVTTGTLQWSELMESLHGLLPGTFPGTSEAFFGRIHPEDRPQVEAAIARARQERTDSNVLYRTEWPDGSIHWISGIGRTSYDERGTPLRAAGIAFDVTERRTLEDQYRQAQKMEAIGQLAGGVAHDFNNLLTAIDGYCELLAGSLDAEDVRHADVDQIRRAAAQATSLTRHLLAFSRQQVLEPRVLDLRVSLESIGPVMQRLIGEHIQVVVHAPEDLGRVKVDPAQIEQVVLNLVLNARDAMPGGGTLTLEVADVELDVSYARQHIPLTPGSYVMLAVSDTGTGIDAALQARIFEPFFTTKPLGHGTGLGLSTVYGIVKQSGGYIWVYSERGRGSTFKVYLPRVRDAIDVPASRAAPEVTRGSETILLVEDQEPLRDVFRRALQKHGYQVLTADTPLHALEIMEQATAPIDLVISDVLLPEMSGVELVTRMLVRHPELRVLFISGYTQKAIAQQGELNTQRPFLQKPFAPLTLARKVREVLDA